VNGSFQAIGMICDDLVWETAASTGRVCQKNGESWYLRVIAPHDDTHDAFMTLPAYTKTREDVARQLGSGL
jgi:hypothetical protein